MKNPTLEQVLDELGITARAEARGEARGETRGKSEGMALGEARGIAQVLDLLKSGKPPEEILQLYSEAAAY
ncbi:MAG: hypothetical protein LBD08_05915 [Treponema sp.]|nr:hypothetical protein [Treponema sp.]